MDKTGQYEKRGTASKMGESATRFPTRVANQTNKRRDELRNPNSRSLATRRVSLVTRMLGVDCIAYRHCCLREGTCRLGQESLSPLQKGLRRYDELREGLMGNWAGLNERGKNLSMLSEVGEEGITAPPPHDLHSLYGHARE